MADTMVPSSKIVGLLQTPWNSHKGVVGLWLIYHGSLVKDIGAIAEAMDLLLGGGGAVVVTIGFLYRVGSIGGVFIMP